MIPTIPVLGDAVVPSIHVLQDVVVEDSLVNTNIL